LRRAGSNPKKAVKFRAKVVVDALKWQVGHNLIYYDMWAAGKVKYDLFDDDDDDGTGIEVDVTVELTEEEEGELLKVASSSQQPSSTSHSEEGSMVLLQSDPEAVSKEADVSTKLGLDKAQGEVRTELSDEYVAPWEDTQFDAKAFPTLLPFGLGGLPGQGHDLADAELERLHLQRGGDRKHQQSMPYVFEKYTRRTRKAAGAIALIASEYTGQGTAPPGEEPAPGIALGNPISELGACTTAADILGVLEKDNGKNLKKLLGRLEPFASGLAGSPLHIANERKQLFAMLASRLLNKDGFLAIFGTCAPTDRFNPELYDIVAPGSDGGRKLTAAERAALLRAHPVLAAKIFDARVTSLFDNIIAGVNCKAQPFGKVTDYWIRVEFQGEFLAFLALSTRSNARA
jgi:hypothetical protein